MRILGLDVGDVRIGVAISDELEIGAYPIVTYTRVGSLKKDVAALSLIAAEQEADMIVVGLPTSLDGGEGPQAKKTRVFAETLAHNVSVPLALWDESSDECRCRGTDAGFGLLARQTALGARPVGRRLDFGILHGASANHGRTARHRHAAVR